MSEYLNPIPDCSYHNEVDTLCNHPSNITPECHFNCCPRLNKEIVAALDASKDNWYCSGCGETDRRNRCIGCNA